MTDDGAVADAKRALRAQMRKVRAAVAADPADRARRSEAICDSVVATIASRRTPPGGQSRILLYDPLPGEPDVATVAEWCAGNDVATYLPVIDGDALRIEPGDLDPVLLDVVVVPGLAFTYGGDRLGQGGGHFDRFLTSLRSDCLRIGVAFHEQLLAELPTAEHDVAVDVVLTDAVDA
jgi:5-formyltetrahydrofolate cyclo-ligase